MVTDTYAHSFDDDRKLIAKEMDSGFFSKVNDEPKHPEPNSEAFEILKKLATEHPEQLKEWLAKLNS